MTIERVKYLLSKHKEMWNWIAENIKQSKKCVNISEMKRTYIKTNSKIYWRFMEYNSNCYLCYIGWILSEHIKGFNKCNFCQDCISHVSECSPYNAACLGGLYQEVYWETSNWRYQYRIAKDIANLKIDLKRVEQLCGIGGQIHDV